MTAKLLAVRSYVRHMPRRPSYLNNDLHILLGHEVRCERAAEETCRELEGRLVEDGEFQRTAGLAL